MGLLPGAISLHPPAQTSSLSLYLSSLLSSSESPAGGFLDATTPVPETRQNCPHDAHSPSLIEVRGDRMQWLVVEWSSSSSNPISGRFVVAMVTAAAAR